MASMDARVTVSVTFTIDGEPVVWERMKVDTRGRLPRFFQSAKVTKAKGEIAKAYITAHPKRELDPAKLWGVSLEFDLGRSRQRKDIDNLTKIILDALNGWAWADDRQVAKLGVTLRRNSEQPRTVCRVYEITES